jgi:hypothetical protein
MGLDADQRVRGLTLRLSGGPCEARSSTFRSSSWSRSEPRTYQPNPQGQTRCTDQKTNQNQAAPPSKAHNTTRRRYTCRRNDPGEVWFWGGDGVPDVDRDTYLLHADTWRGHHARNAAPLDPAGLELARQASQRRGRRHEGSGHQWQGKCHQYTPASYRHGDRVLLTAHRDKRGTNSSSDLHCTLTTLQLHCLLHGYV